MESYFLSMNTRTYFGNKCVKDALNVEKQLIGEKTLLITTGGALNRLGFVEELCSWIDTEVVVYDKITPDPDVVEIREAVKLGKEQGVSG